MTSTPFNATGFNDIGIRAHGTRSTTRSAWLNAQLFFDRIGLYPATCFVRLFKFLNRRWLVSSNYEYQQIEFHASLLVSAPTIQPLALRCQYPN
jgi:hypothetical protein